MYREGAEDVGRWWGLRSPVKGKLNVLCPGQVIRNPDAKTLLMLTFLEAGIIQVDVGTVKGLLTVGNDCERGLHRIEDIVDLSPN